MKNHQDDLVRLLTILPSEIRDAIYADPEWTTLCEVVMDLGAFPEIRFESRSVRLTQLHPVSLDHITSVTDKLGPFNTDNRAGIERTLHRISAIRNRHGLIIGLTARVGRAIEGVIELVRDTIESGQNVLLLGPPGMGKTTLLREAARVLADHRRVIVVDTSNEIAGEGDIPHPGIGFARRMQVPAPDRQHAVMIEAVENHMPEVIIVDEIGTEEEAAAARTIAERGTQLIATAHGKTLQNLIKNPTLSDLAGGVHSVVLGDEEAKFRGTQKTVLERKTIPTFDILIELLNRDCFAVFPSIAQSVDALLRSEVLSPQIRQRGQDNSITIQDAIKPNTPALLPKPPENKRDHVHIFAFGINVAMLSKAITALELEASVVQDIDEADVVLTSKSHMRSKSKLSHFLEGHNIPVHVLKANTLPHIEKFLREYWGFPNP